MRRLILILVFLWAGVQVFAQLSQGGSPIVFPRLKKLSDKVLVDLPHLNNEKLLKTSLDKLGKDLSKPFRFAESVPVCLNPENSGEWIKYDNHRIWTLEIRSAGAKSLNLIFDQYYLPADARLFVYSAEHNYVLGAFTSENNKESGILAVAPVYGDHLVIQYEEPIDVDFSAELSIAEVNHDYVGIVSLKDQRRPKGLSGSCNVNVNCDYLDKHQLQKNAVMRLIIGGKKLCSGSLLNNTNNDGTPYVYSAGHCISSQRDAERTVFLFNYESPYCGQIDGDASRSLSGSNLKAQSDSLDFSLVEMSVLPPPTYRPYYLGWDRGDGLPDSTVCIHHPQGDIKKIAIDNNRPLIKSYNNDYIRNAFFFIGNWEEGTTEGGSSGAGLLNQNGLFIGSLTGGAATCNDPSKDYFSRFYNAWDHYSEPSQSLKSWLDPKGSNLPRVEGLIPYDGILLCGAFTNFRDDDQHELKEIIEGEQSKGLWSGNNDYGFDCFAEKFEQDTSVDIAGVAMGVAKANKLTADAQSKIKIQVHNGDQEPEEMIYEQEFFLNQIDPEVMNYFEFDQIVTTDGSFFISYSIDLLQPADTFSVYLADRQFISLNSFLIKDGNEWYTYQDKTGGTEGSALLMEAVLCNIDINLNENNLKSEELDFYAFPNPISRGNNILYLNFEEEITPEKVGIYDLSGSLVSDKFKKLDEKWISLNFSGFRTGTYLVRIIDDKEVYQTKILFLD